MEHKNVRCVKVLLSLALTDGNLLRESWGLVLRCISQLARYMVASVRYMRWYEN